MLTFVEVSRIRGYIEKGLRAHVPGYEGNTLLQEAFQTVIGSLPASDEGSTAVLREALARPDAEEVFGRSAMLLMHRALGIELDRRRKEEAVALGLLGPEPASGPDGRKTVWERLLEGA